MLGALLFVMVLIFHFYNQQKNSSSFIDFANGKNILCKAIGLIIYVCYFWYQMSNLLHFSQMYLRLKHSLGREKQLQMKHCIVISLVGVGVICGQTFLFKNSDMVNAICLVDFTEKGNILKTIVSGVIALCVIALVCLILQQIKHARKMSKRVKSKSEKQLETRMYLYAFVATASFLAEASYQLNLSRNIAVYLFLLYFHLAIIPMSFIIIFVFMSRNFKNSFACER